MNSIKILLFYKYVPIENTEKFRKELLKMCEKIGLKGRILVAEEGINGSVSGSEEQTEIFKKSLKKDKRFSDIIFKEDEGMCIPFRKMIVKIKKELVSFGQKVSLENTGKYLSPKEFLDLYKNNEEVVFLDARNDYESAVGKFKGAITPPIKTFREFPKVLDLIKDKKDKKIVMYCTGGIRCEKASAYLKEKGFKDVSQLHGGILTFGKEYPDTVWEGTCFVFDKRMTSAVNNDNKPITKCKNCGVACDLYKNCRNVSCDKYVVLCVDCEQKLVGCCSQECKKEYLKSSLRAPRGFRYLNN